MRAHSNIAGELLLNLQAMMVGIGAICIAGTSFCIRYLRRYK